MSDLSALALNAAVTLSPWELHGVVCGLIVSDPAGRWGLQELLDLVGADAVTDESSVEVFVSAVVDELSAEDLSFALLLPDDDAPIELRTEALAEWSGGFLAGFGVTMAYRGWDVLPEEAQEIIDDLAAVSELDPSQVGDQTEMESAESDLLQVQEFVKVGVLLIMGLLDADSGE